MCRLQLAIGGLRRVTRRAGLTLLTPQLGGIEIGQHALTVGQCQGLILQDAPIRAPGFCGGYFSQPYRRYACGYICIKLGPGRFVETAISIVVDQISHGGVG